MSSDGFAGSAAGEEWGQFCAALAGQGHAVTAYPRQQVEQPAGQIELPYLTQPAGVGPPVATSPAKVLPHVGEWAADLKRRWSTEPPDIVHSFGWLGGLAAQLAARHFSLTTVQSFYGLAATAPGGGNPADFERARLEPLLIRSAAWVTAGSSDELDVLTRMRHNRARASVLSVGINVERYAGADPKRPENEKHRILQVAPSLAPVHGLDRTIQALPHIPGSELVIAETAAADRSDRQLRTRLKRMATECGVNDRVVFAGHVAAADLPALLWSADVVACTPRLAPRATPALQAMAGGKVVVGTAVGALTDTVIGGVTGLLVPESKPRELVIALKALQGQRFQRDSMGSAGRCRAISRFAWDRIALDALSTYHQASPLTTAATA